MQIIKSFKGPLARRFEVGWTPRSEGTLEPTYGPSARLGVLTPWEDRGQHVAGRQRRKLFRAPGEEGIVADQDRTNALLRKTSEGPFEIAIGSGIRNSDLQAQLTRRRLQVWNEEPAVALGPHGREFRHVWAA